MYNIFMLKYKRKDIKNLNVLRSVSANRMEIQSELLVCSKTDILLALYLVDINFPTEKFDRTDI